METRALSEFVIVHEMTPFVQGWLATIASWILLNLEVVKIKHFLRLSMLNNWCIGEVVCEVNFSLLPWMLVPPFLASQNNLAHEPSSSMSLFLWFNELNLSTVVGRQGRHFHVE
jgi:hypothetical protein